MCSVGLLRLIKSNPRHVTTTHLRAFSDHPLICRPANCRYEGWYPFVPYTDCLAIDSCTVPHLYWELLGIKFSVKLSFSVWLHLWHLRLTGATAGVWTTTFWIRVKSVAVISHRSNENQWGDKNPAHSKTLCSSHAHVRNLSEISFTQLCLWREFISGSDAVQSSKTSQLFWTNILSAVCFLFGSVTLARYP
jgi:hypothetical protein